MNLAGPVGAADIASGGVRRHAADDPLVANVPVRRLQSVASSPVCVNEHTRGTPKGVFVHLSVAVGASVAVEELVDRAIGALVEVLHALVGEG